MDSLHMGVVIGVSSSFLACCLYIGIVRMCQSCKRVELKQSRSDGDLASLNVETY
jgi:hypothetical protein